MLAFRVVFRGQYVVRCPRCLVEAKYCICPMFRPIETATRVVMIAHVREVEKTTNTGRILLEMLPRAELHVRGLPGKGFAEVELDDEARPLVLHPDADEELSPAHRHPSNVLLVPDGTWPQSRRMLRREPLLARARRVRLPAGAPSSYRLRESPTDVHLSTLEAVARALAVLEGPAVEAELLAVFDAMVTRMLVTRGKLRESVLEPDPR